MRTTKRFWILIAILVALGAIVLATPDARANEIEFTKEVYTRDDGRVASKCAWDYGDMKITFNVKLGLCFEDRSTIGDTGYRYPDGSARYEYIEFVGKRNATRSINEWVLIDRGVRQEIWKDRQEELESMRIDRSREKIEKEISSIRLELERLLAKLSII